MSAPADADSPHPPASPNRRNLLRSLAILAALLSLGSAVSYALRHPVSVDFYQYRLTSDAIGSQGLTDIYSPRGRAELGRLSLDTTRHLPAGSPERQAARLCAQLYGGAMDANGTPFIYWIFAPSTWLSYDSARQLFMFLLISCYGVVCLFYCHIRGLAWPLALVVFAYLFLVFSPLRAELRVLNVAGLQLALIGMFLLLRRGDASPARDLAAMAVLGISVAFKPTMALTPLLLLIDKLFLRKFKQTLVSAAGLLLGLFASVLVSTLWFSDLRAWLGWAGILPSLLQSRYRLDHGNIGLSSLLFHLTGWNLTLPLLLSGLVLVGVKARWAHLLRALPTHESPHPGVDRTYAVTALSLALTLLAARLAWLHYFSLLLPLLIDTLARSLRRGARPARALAGLSALLCLSSLCVHLPVSHVGLALLRNLGLLALMAAAEIP